MLKHSSNTLDPNAKPRFVSIYAVPYPFVWQPFLAIFVYARLPSQSKGSILYIA